LAFTEQYGSDQHPVMQSISHRLKGMSLFLFSMVAKYFGAISNWTGFVEKVFTRQILYHGFHSKCHYICVLPLQTVWTCSPKLTTVYKQVNLSAVVTSDSGPKITSW